MTLNSLIYSALTSGKSAIQYFSLIYFSSYFSTLINWVSKTIGLWEAGIASSSALTVPESLHTKKGEIQKGTENCTLSLMCLIILFGS